MKHWLLLVVLSLLLLGGCVDSGVCDTPGEVEISVIISDQGISVTGTAIQISNFRANTSVTAIYAITNETSNDITPEIFLNTDVIPGDYEIGIGYELIPEIAIEWVNISAVPVIPPGGSVDLLVIFQSPPKINEELPDKYAFRTGIAGNTGGMYQTAAETWWLVDMR